MVGENHDHERGVGDETHNEIGGGQFHGPVFQGRDFGEVNIGTPIPEYAATYYRKMRERLDEEERREGRARNEELRSLRAERVTLMLRLVLFTLWFLWGSSVHYDDTLSFSAGIIPAVGLVAGPIIAVLACAALWRNRARMNEVKRQHS
ncbi:hypothetical protein ABZX30_34660 [Streptomyces sp. NPDC004542]|uniref:hypothetical protein n=1 Tax=Streptomyces sp. NPDC004542 TaxID=3154281 RepID=UPI0033AA66B3